MHPPKEFLPPVLCRAARGFWVQLTRLYQLCGSEFMRACEVMTLWDPLPPSCSAIDRPIYIYKQGNDAAQTCKSRDDVWEL